MRRTGRRDDDDTLIPGFTKARDKKLQKLINISRVTELTDATGNSTRPRPSIAREVQRAITLHAATKGTDSNDHQQSGLKKHQDSSTSKDPFSRSVRCNIYNNRGHKTSEHKDEYKPGDKNKNKEGANGNAANKKPGKSCFKCLKPWKAGHTCIGDETPQNNNTNVRDDNSVSDLVLLFGDKLSAVIVDAEEQVNTSVLPADAEQLLYTPVLINEVPGHALVDSGATSIFISKKFVNAHSIPFEARTVQILNGKEEKMADRERIVNVTIKNGEKSIQCTPDIMKMRLGRDLVIGLSHFSKLGYKISGVPAAIPTLAVTQPEPNYLEKEEVDGLTAAELDASVDEAVRDSQKHTEVPAWQFRYHCNNSKFWGSSYN